MAVVLSGVSCGHKVMIWVRTGYLTSSFLGLSRETGNAEMVDSGHFWLLLALCYQGDVCDMSPYMCVPHGCGALWRLVWS
jgi:hypothetical protein